ncbi:MAG: ATP-binding protein [Planctomycetota bacterium]|nr:ATP-binding protein [Planctomycetota bacterium]
MPSFFVIQGRDRGTRFELEKPVLSIGRDVRNDIRLQDTEISRRHAEIRRTDDGFAVHDLGSSNGTFVNGSAISAHTLRSGDQLLLGRTLMLYTGGGASAVFDGEVDIVAASRSEDSRILTTMTESEGSRSLLHSEVTDSESPWLARARSNLQIMYRTALAVSHTLDIDELLDRIMGLIFEWVEADRGCIMLVNNESGALEPRVRRNRDGVSSGAAISISKTILDYVTEHTEGVLTSNAKDDKRWDTGASILNMDIREAICVPMRGRYGVVGVIYIDTSSRPQQMLEAGGNKFREEHLKLMIAIAHQAALAVEDTSYYSAMLQAERLAAVGQTIATLSHHIKNILQGIRGGSYLIEMGLAEDDKDVMRRGWHIVEKNQGRISNLVLDMLTFSKEREPQLVASSLNEVVGDVVELMQARSKELDVALNWTPSEAIPELLFDPEGMHRAVLNVVTNALDACEEVEGGKVDVSIKIDRQKKIVQVMVEDNGSGIPAEEVEKMFTLFVSSKGSRGTGLGLSVSQKICKEHGGQIIVESELGQGSRFALEIPTVFPPEGAAPPSGDGSSICEPQTT